MRIGIAPAEPPAVFNTRTRWPAEALAAQGEIELVPLADDVKFNFVADKPVGLATYPDVDVLVITRPLSGAVVQTIPFFQRKGIAVVVDIDDNFRHLQPTMATRGKIDPSRNPLYNWRHFAYACAIADYVTCATDGLLRYGSHGRIRVVRNCVPTSYLEIEKNGAQSATKIVGWSGTVPNHPGDLDVTHGGVGRAVSEAGAEFLVVGERAGVQRSLTLTNEPYETGVSAHEEYPELLSQLDVGIAPLADNAYNQAKSWLKPLEYTALGIPWVASRTPEYELLHGGLLRALEDDLPSPGVLASARAREWRRGVTRALSAPEESLAAGRRFVADHLTVEANAYTWAEAWELALANRRGSNARHP